MVKLFIKLIIYFVCKKNYDLDIIDIGNLFFEILIIIFKMIRGEKILN